MEYLIMLSNDNIIIICILPYVQSCTQALYNRNNAREMHT